MNRKDKDYPFNSAEPGAEYPYLDDEADVAEEVLKNGFYEYSEGDSHDLLPLDCFLDGVQDVDVDEDPVFKVSMRAAAPLEEVFTCTSVTPFCAMIGCVQMAKQAYADLMSAFGPDSSEF